MLQTLEDVRAYLRDSLQQTNNGHDADERVVTQLGSEPQLSVLLRCVLNDRDALDECASKSYQHANGFDKLVILSSEHPQYKLRLHMWWPGRHDVTEHVHNHRWSFASIVVHGSLEAHVYERSDRGSLMHEYRYFSPEGGTTYRMDLVGTARLTALQHVVMPTGTLYSLTKDVLHRVVPTLRQLTATLFLQGAAVRQSTNVFTDLPLAIPEETSSEPMRPAAFAARVHRYLSHVRQCR
jgi:hypothetical protein